mmetsp:Transcript_13795/g.39157  ORF Transcript_13795/g.39157 Transcript_13795/m.39157 type:complete len:238 (-) Transcript_13795:644-1357(-)
MTERLAKPTLGAIKKGSENVGVVVCRVAAPVVYPNGPILEHVGGFRVLQLVHSGGSLTGRLQILGRVVVFLGLPPKSLLAALLGSPLSTLALIPAPRRRRARSVTSGASPTGAPRSLGRVDSGVAEREQVAQPGELEEAPLPWVRQDFIRQVLLEDLAMIDLLLNRATGNQSINSDLLGLAHSPCSLASLHVRAWVPVRVVQHDAVGADQVNSETADFGGKQEHKHAFSIIIEAVNE